MIKVRLSGPGGHTSRPHNTVDLVYALGQLLTDLPAALTRVIDPRAAVTLVWGMVEAGSAANAIPQTASARGTVRVLDRDTWATGRTCSPGSPSRSSPRTARAWRSNTGAACLRSSTIRPRLRC